MPDNTKARSDEIAAKATELAAKVDFLHCRIYPASLATLYEQLMITADCSHSTAVRHIQAALGLTEPVGRLKCPFPVQRFNYRATNFEAECIKAKLKEYADRLLFELRLLAELQEGEND